MQQVKDSFFMTVSTRLTPAAAAVCENQCEGWLVSPGTFYLRWLGEGTVSPDAGAAGWRSLRCQFAYRTRGTDLATGVDRGRILAQLDEALQSVLIPRSAALKDYSTAPETDQGCLLLWTAPKFGDPKDDAQGLQRTVELDILWREDA